MEEVRELSSEVCLPMSSNIEERLGKAIGGGLWYQVIHRSTYSKNVGDEIISADCTMYFVHRFGVVARNIIIPCSSFESLYWSSR
jgi:hypothetical protein